MATSTLLLSGVDIVTGTALPGGVSMATGWLLGGVAMATGTLGVDWVSWLPGGVAGGLDVGLLLGCCWSLREEMRGVSGATPTKQPESRLAAAEAMPCSTQKQVVICTAIKF